MKAKKLTKSDIETVRGFLSYGTTKYCFPHTDPWYAASSQNSDSERVRERLRNRATIESLRFAKGFPYAREVKEWDEREGIETMEYALKAAAGHILSERGIVRVRRPESSGNKGDYWGDVSYEHLPLFARMGEKEAEEYREAFFGDDPEDTRKQFDALSDVLVAVEAEAPYAALLPDGERRKFGNAVTEAPSEGELAFLRTVSLSGYLSNAYTRIPESMYGHLSEEMRLRHVYERNTEENYEKSVNWLYWRRLAGFAFSEWGRLHGLTRLWGDGAVYAFLSEEDRAKHDSLVDRNDAGGFRKFKRKLAGKTFTL